MAFDSAAFLFSFLPLLLILRPWRAASGRKTSLLCLAGLIFYAFGELGARAAYCVASSTGCWGC